MAFAKITPSDSANFTKTVITPVEEVAQDTTVVVAGTDTFTIVWHGWSNGDKVRCTVLGDCDGIALNGEYFIINAATDTFKVSANYGGSAVNVTATVTVFPSLKRIEKVETQKASGDIYVGVTGHILALPSENTETTVTTDANLGAVLFKNVPQGTILKGPFKRVFSTTTTATDLVLITT